MITLHEKSPCCRGDIRCYGKRRRQCTKCHSTWRVWQKKKGRKNIRSNFNVLYRYLDGKITSLIHQARNRSIKPAAYSARLRNTLNKFLIRTPWPSIPDTSLIIIADALIQNIDGKIWTTYLFLVRPIRGKQAIILPPYTRFGSEHCHGGWKEAFNTIPQHVKNRVIAFVSDGAQEAIREARIQGWHIQRCHFHLLFRIANYVRPGPLSRNRALAQKLYPLVYTVLYNPDEACAETAVNKLEEIISKIRSESLKTTISGFVKHYEDYRAYLRIPEYNLPATSNSAEAFIGQIRRLFFRARGYRTITSYQKWIEALCKYRKTIACNGKINQPN